MLPKRSLLYVLLIFCPFVNQAQNLANGILDYTDSTQWVVRLGANRSDLSNALPMDFIFPFIFGGNIDQSVLSDVNSNLESENDYFNELEGGVDLVYYPKTKKLGFGINYNFTQTGNVGFTDDLFNLLFYGNSSFGSEPAILNESKAVWQIYQRLSGRVHHRISGSYVGLGIYIGSTYGNYDLGSTASLTNVYEQIAGSQIITALKYSTSEGTSEVSDNGVGVGLSGSFNFRGFLGNLNVSFDDLGIMTWKNTSQSDTSGIITFAGYNWEYGSDPKFGDILDNLVDSLLPTENISNVTKTLPTKLSLTYYTPRFGPFSARVNLQHRVGIYPRPQANAALNFHIDRQIIWLGFSAAGSQWPGINVGAQLAIGQSVYFLFGSQYVQGLVSGEARQLNLHSSFIVRI